MRMNVEETCELMYNQLTETRKKLTKKEGLPTRWELMDCGEDFDEGDLFDVLEEAIDENEYILVLDVCLALVARIRNKHDLERIYSSLKEVSDV